MAFRSHNKKHVAPEPMAARKDFEGKISLVTGKSAHAWPDSGEEGSIGVHCVGPTLVDPCPTPASRAFSPWGTDVARVHEYGPTVDPPESSQAYLVSLTVVVDVNTDFNIPRARDRWYF